jgi:DNA-binding NarL/FixJ family response regulator
MTNQPSQILFATDRPLFVVGFLGVLERAGFERPPVMRNPRDAFAEVGREDACLVFADASHVHDSGKLSEAVRRSPQSRFVLCGATVTPEILQTAVDSGAHGVLSTGLPAQEAAETLTRIWQGERHFRFPGRPVRGMAPTRSARRDFDAEWMFSQAV